jgi:MinD-like ATPase involved in chromosome partitioning or flagellar assembly
MPLIALASVKGSPGVTTTALALAAAWPAPGRLLLEADPGGGDLGPWLGLPPAPGLVGLAAAVRHDQGASAAWLHSQEAGGGLQVVVAPVGAEQASACLTTLTGTVIGDPFTREPGVVIADCGRLDPGSPALAVAAQAEVTLLLVRPQVSGLAHVAPRLAGFSRAGLRLGLLLAPSAGRVPAEAAYSEQEISATLGLPVYASIPADSRAAAHLTGCRGVPGKTLLRRPLLRAAASLAVALAAGTGPPPPSLPEPDGRTGARDVPAPGGVTAVDQHS